MNSLRQISLNFVKLYNQKGKTRYLRNSGLNLIYFQVVLISFKYFMGKYVIHNLFREKSFVKIIKISRKTDEFTGLNFIIERS